ncbi:hypothetical protein QE152_g5440 [Popillia japonica]|uniref:PHD-type domain-containing protein n=1 Tax=Popillia japonica TaxID=7064 RepID=A0AAW1MQJ3_POPJA
MAPRVNALCVKCHQKLENDSDKVLHCSGGCSNYLHHTCSVFKPTELKIFETYSKNVKWFCDTCGTSKSGGTVSDLQSEIMEIKKKIDELMMKFNEQSENLKQHNNLNYNLQTKQVVQSQTDSVSGPRTRSKVSSEVANNTVKSYSDVLNRSSDKKEDKKNTKQHQKQ